MPSCIFVGVITVVIVRRSGRTGKLQSFGDRKEGRQLKRELDIVDEGIRRNEKTPEDVYPANRISVKCGGCKERIGAGEGYSHYLIGTRRFFCRECHVRKSFPLRDGDIVKIGQTVIIGGEGKANEV